jgi:nitrogen fixation NifU-like protein
MTTSGPLYGGRILERFRRPRYFGEVPGACLVHEDVNPLCGDRLRVQLRVEQGRLVTVRFQGDACAIAVAAADVAAEMVEGGPVGRALALDREAILAALGARVRPSRLGCAGLGLAVLRGALAGATGGPAGGGGGTGG